MFKGKCIHVIFNSKLWFVNYNCLQALLMIRLEDIQTKYILKQISRISFLLEIRTTILQLHHRLSSNILKKI